MVFYQSRDENIARAGTRTPDDSANVVALGVFNEIPWSRTTQNFVAAGDYRDSRTLYVSEIYAAASSP